MNLQVNVVTYMNGEIPSCCRHAQSLTRPNAIHIICRTSVYATEYRPPRKVYATAIQAEMMMDMVAFSSRMTDKEAPGYRQKDIS